MSPQRRPPAEQLADTAGSILDRRDVAAIGCYSVTGIAVMAAVSSVLRPNASTADHVVTVLALASAIIGAVISLLLDRPRSVSLRAQPATYFGAAAVITGVLAGVAIADDGLASLYLSVIVLIAAYMGLILPSRWSAAAIVMIVGFLLAVQAFNPEAPSAAAASVLALSVAGYLVGWYAHRAHAGAARVEDILSRSDTLTAMLNRRGFFEEFEWELDRADESHQPLSLLVVDLDRFHVINEDGGYPAGDALLEWIGATLAQLLPRGASAGRLGADEFAIVLPNTDQTTADGLAGRIAAGIANRIGASIGAATYLPGVTEPDADALVRIADAEVAALKRGLNDVALPAPGTIGQRQPTPSRRLTAAAPVPKPVVTYRQLCAAGGPPSEAVTGVQFAWVLSLGWWLIGAAGVVVAATQIASGGDTFYDLLIRVGVIPWVAVCFICGGLASRKGGASPRLYQVSYYLSTALLGLGVGAVLLANDGILGPLVAGFYLKVIADAFVMPARAARGTLATMLAWWLLVVVLGPTDAYWAMPFELAIFAASHKLGVIAHRAFVEATGRTHTATETDPLTGLRNRAGLETDIAGALARTEDPARQLAVLYFGIDGFKAINQRLGHSGGDALLRQVAAIAHDRLTTADSIGRISGADFVAVVPVSGRDEAALIGAQLGESLEPVASVSVGHALHPEDGLDLAALLGAADPALNRPKRERGKPAGRRLPGVAQ